MKLFCFGLGYTAQHLIQKLSPETWQFSGTKRSSTDIIFDGETPMVNAQEHLHDITHLLISIAPNENQIDPVLFHHRKDIINMPNLQWIGYLSTTGVYGDHNGAWVDETTQLVPSETRGKLRLKAEQQWSELGLPLRIFRLGGIYGPNRNQIKAVKAGTARKLLKENHTFSRIHVQDIANAIMLSMKSSTQENIFNIVDDQPSSSADVLDYICDQIDVPQIVGTQFETADLSPMMKSFYADNKKVKNTLAKKVLNWKPQYPSFKEGYGELLRNFN